MDILVQCPRLSLLTPGSGILGELTFESFLLLDMSSEKTNWLNLLYLLWVPCGIYGTSRPDRIIPAQDNLQSASSLGTLAGLCSGFYLLYQSKAFLSLSPHPSSYKRAYSKAPFTKLHGPVYIALWSWSCAVNCCLAMLFSSSKYVCHQKCKGYQIPQRDKF